jgi:hypothetical protein
MSSHRFDGYVPCQTVLVGISISVLVDISTPSANWYVQRYKKRDGIDSMIWKTKLFVNQDQSAR